jgi:Mn-dependent DtxR family transcriptional regulator
LQRHNIIELFLKNLGVKEDILVETELIEHNISADALQKMNIFNKFFEQNPEILKRFIHFTQYNL